MCETIMEAVSLTKHFRSADKTWFTAVDGASISLQKGKTLGLLGQSGSGKSTLGQMMVGLLKPIPASCFSMASCLAIPFEGRHAAGFRFSFSTRRFRSIPSSRFDRAWLNPSS